MAAAELLSALLQHNIAKGYKSNVLNPLIWLTGTFFIAIVGAIISKAPTWILIVLIVLLILIIGLFSFAYCFCLIKNPDALRSEKYSIEKMAIEKGYIGDSIKGMMKKESFTAQGEVAAELIDDDSSEG